MTMPPYTRFLHVSQMYEPDLQRAYEAGLADFKTSSQRR
jgi:hypothetical protein